MAAGASHALVLRAEGTVWGGQREGPALRWRTNGLRGHSRSVFAVLKEGPPAVCARLRIGRGAVHSGGGTEAR
ncbi:hypothetical protein [Stigmatella erecta]|uniref:hypothetical protein n=1 Tax=Stigmatella erecta TaxID=83460 RepID=UPI003CCC3328